ncbi:unknown [Choristoneura occidentalis granulovirus]|uniref:Uncharacterized protein n=1 Tax=Choristoneura occidentalis granulovirus TaxID=364745 RepID=Q1A4I8_9BBAC|nr:unknown [Choristoneura fumiferana granulovirus]ABC61242.1 unknown [Choristoneura fumiferana granulovirus]
MKTIILICLILMVECLPLMSVEDYKQTSLIVNILSCVFQFIEVILVIIFALYKMNQ